MNGDDTPRLCVAPPPPALSGVVDSFWQIERSPHEPHPIYLPVPNFEIVACTRGQLTGGAEGPLRAPFLLLAPPRLRPLPLAPTERLTLFGVRLRATAMADLGWCHAREAQAYPPLPALLGEPASLALRALSAAGSFEERTGVLGDFLLRLRGPRRVRATPAERRALERVVTEGRRPVDAAERRATQRAFSRWIGMSPLDFRVVQRFDEALRAMFLDQHHENIAAIAARLGYADQAHLSRHFRRFAWSPPAEFSRSMNAWLRAPLPAV